MSDADEAHNHDVPKNTINGYVEVVTFSGICAIGIIITVAAVMFRRHYRKDRLKEAKTQNNVVKYKNYIFSQRLVPFNTLLLPLIHQNRNKKDLKLCQFSDRYEHYGSFKDVLCLDATRVPLAPIRGQLEPYIHANFVATPLGLRRFIASKGPTNDNMFNFWSMVVQYNVQVIVMLCKHVEDGIVYSAPYFPTVVGQNVSYRLECNEIIGISLLEEQNMGGYMVRSMLIRYDNQQSRLTHYQLLDWDDNRTPTPTPPPKLFLELVRNSTRISESPIVVHCNAGIGRTGTFLYLALMMDRLEAGLPIHDVEHVLAAIRRCRDKAVQSDVHFMFAHRVMLYYIFEDQAYRFYQLQRCVNFYCSWVAEYNKYIHRTTIRASDCRKKRKIKLPEAADSLDHITRTHEERK